MIKLPTCAALITAISMTGSAWAVDMPARYRAPVAPLPVVACSWCGFYVGLNAGANWGRSEPTLTPREFWSQDPNAALFGDSGSPRFKQTNFSGGGQVGINSQSGNLVVGLEADVEYIGFSVSRNATFTGPFAGPFGGTAEVFNFADSVKDSWVSTQRLRFGWAASPAFLVYGTGGLRAVGAAVLSDLHYSELQWRWPGAWVHGLGERDRVGVKTGRGLGSRRRRGMEIRSQLERTS